LTTKTSEQLARDRHYAIQRIRDSVPLPARVGDLYDGNGRLRTEFMEHGPAERAIQKLHRRAGEAVPNQDALPVGIQQALHLPLIWVQIVSRYPWKVMWVRHDSTGRVRRGELKCTTLGGAIYEWRRIRKLAPNATIVSRARGYHIPPELRGELPPRWYWCPHCMKPRRYQRDPDNRTFTTNKKVWSDTKGRFVWVERKVYILVCPMCHNNSRDPIFRMSNQPWETRRFKQGVRRAKPRQRTRRKRGKS